MRFRSAIGLVLTAVLLAGGAAPASAITREEIVARAYRWADIGVPYSQTSTFDGYRTDCSGMASMAWHLEQSYSTRTLAPKGVLISRDDLQPGDMLLKYDYHAAIFYKWADAEHTWYWTLEESSSAGKAVCRLTRYPYWDVDGFEAYSLATVVEVDDWGPYVTQVAGSDRYQTAIAASKMAFSDGEASSAVICSGRDWPDALGASALAGTLGAPMLLTAPDSLSAGLLDELARLGVTDVVIVGGTGAVGSAVQQQLAAAPGVTVSRIGGVDRYATAALVASETLAARDDAGLPIDHAAYLVTGLTFADALGAATVSASTGRPILLTKPGSIPTSTIDAVHDLEIDHVYVAGGTAAVHQEVVTRLAAEGVDTVDRIAGADRYETAYALAEHGSDEGLVWDDVAIATGGGFADALAGAVMQARRGSLLVLTPTRNLAPAADRAIRQHQPAVDDVTVLGGTSAVSTLARRQIRWIIDEP